jgi:hypothetical protein
MLSHDRPGVRSDPLCESGLADWPANPKVMKTSLQTLALTALATATLCAPASAQAANPFGNTSGMLHQAEQLKIDSRAGSEGASNSTPAGKKAAASSPKTTASAARGPSARTTAGDTPGSKLVRAAALGRLEEIKTQLSAGAPLDSRDGDGNTMLHAAALKGQLEVAQYLVGQPNIAIDARDKVGSTPLMLAAGAGQVDVVKLLLDKGADYKLQNNDGKSALHGAAANGHPKVVEALLTAGADPNQKDAHGKTPLDLTEKYQQGEWPVVETRLKAAQSSNP